MGTAAACLPFHARPLSFSFFRIAFDLLLRQCNRSYDSLLDCMEPGLREKPILFLLLFTFFFFFYFWTTDLFSCFMFNKNPRPKLSPISANYPLPQITLYKHSFELHVRRRKFVSPEMREQYHNLPFKTKLA